MSLRTPTRRLGASAVAIVVATALALTGCVATYNEADHGGYKSCSPAYKADSQIGNFTIQQSAPGRSLQWGAYPYKQYSGTWYNVIVYAGGVKIDAKSQPYAPHGSVGQDRRDLTGSQPSIEDS
ncbi:hypothetical protein [Leifsonia poae]|uniref:hypothetical protein n=1 Tax=Leifsonia poae TaxID=110933 RepID=UPI003D66CF02